MRAKRLSLAVGGCVALVALSGVEASAQQSAEAQRAVLDQYCVRCHNARLTSGKLRLDTADVTAVGEHGEVWEKVVRKLRGGVMPPPGNPRPEPAAYEALTSWVEGELDRYAENHPNPGRTESFHRLYRTEYQNIVRDLLALDMDFTDPSCDTLTGEEWGMLHRLELAILRSAATSLHSTPLCVLTVRSPV